MRSLNGRGQCPKILQAQLLPYQRQVLARLREKGNPPATISRLGGRSPFILEMSSRSIKAFTNIATDFIFQNEELVLARSDVPNVETVGYTTLETVALTILRQMI